MKKTYKKLVAFGLALGMTVASCMTAFAGQWMQNDFGWWYQNDDNSYPANGWSWIANESSGVSRCYYFDESGYMLADSETPDGFYVDESGAWVENGVIQEKAAESNGTTSHVTNADKARQDLYDQEGKSFEARSNAVFTYLQSLGYVTDDLTIDSSSVRYSGIVGSAGAPLYEMLRYNSQEALNAIADYMGGGSAYRIIQAVEDYQAQ